MRVSPITQQPHQRHAWALNLRPAAPLVRQSSRRSGSLGETMLRCSRSPSSHSQNSGTDRRQLILQRSWRSDSCRATSWTSGKSTPRQVAADTFTLSSSSRSRSFRQGAWRVAEPGLLRPSPSGPALPPGLATAKGSRSADPSQHSTASSS